MRAEIVTEVWFFLSFVVLGAGAALFYDIFRVFRRLFGHSLLHISLQDFLFWFLLGIASFSLMYRFNAGVPRLLVPYGLALGCIIYTVTVGKYFIRLFTALLRSLFFPFRKVLLFFRKRGKLFLMGIRNNKKKHGRADANAVGKEKKKNRT